MKFGDLTYEEIREHARSRDKKPYHAIWCRISDPSIPNLHAGTFTTSIALHLRPETVRLDRVPASETAAIDSSDPEIDFSRHSRSGVMGDPTRASAELGAELWKACVEEAAN